ncbi:MAG: hypothetical protein Q4C53_00385 [Clostridia bacterium]|nr:hypothetical protein [Clostridia bacterium]
MKRNPMALCVIALMLTVVMMTAALAETGVGTYTVYNVTGEKVTELYLHVVGADKGENLAAEGLRNGKKTVLTFEAEKDATLALEFVTEGGRSAAFETLHIEEAPVALLAVDAMTGATPIAFSVPQETGNYTFVNKTGETVTELYVTPAGEEKGLNLAGEGMADGETFDFSFTGPVDTELVVSFTTAKDGEKVFETLHIETVKIGLLAADAMTGATPIVFGF